MLAELVFLSFLVYVRVCLYVFVFVVFVYGKTVVFHSYINIYSNFQHVISTMLLRGVVGRL